MECLGLGCRLCLELIVNNDFATMEEANKNMLQILIPVINWGEVREQTKICQKCSKNVEAFGQFKCFCLNKNRKTRILQELGETLEETLSTSVMCCLCHRKPVFEASVEGVVNLKEMLHRCFPQLILSFDESGCCEKCLSKLKDLDLFIICCLETEECIKKYCSTMDISKKDFNSDEYIKRKYGLPISADNGIVPLNVERDAPPEEMETIALENNFSPENVQESNGMDPIGKEINTQQDTDNSEENAIVQVADNSSGQENSLENRESQSSGKFNCDKCNYSAEYKSALISHMVKHREPPSIKMHKCEECGHETKRIGDLKWHMIIHKDPEEVKMYQCADCPYRTKRKADLKQHVLVHRSHVFKCELCSFQTKNEVYLKTVHKMCHEDASKVKLYKCDVCSFKTKREKNLKSHSKTMHEERAEKFRCNWCDFETNYKQGVKEHMLVHKCISERKRFKCYSCGYKATRKSHLRDHMLRHAKSEVTYDCDRCSYKGRVKTHLKRHMKKHENPSETRKYKCDFCDTYQGTKKYRLKSHMYTHIKQLQALENKQAEIEQIMSKISDMYKTSRTFKNLKS